LNKETKILKEVIEKHKFCDICGSQIKIGLACSKAYCLYCKKDLCEKCIGHEEEAGGDYRIVYCVECWKTGDEYRPIIEQHEIEIHKLYTEWQNKCKNEIK
jgi:hypothetical protein